MMAARSAALALLNKVLAQKQTLNEAMERTPEFKALPLDDKRFCENLAATALRRLGQIDDVLARAEERPAPRNITAQNILRLSAAEICFTNMTDHAAIESAVKLAAAADLSKQAPAMEALLTVLVRLGRGWAERQDAGRINTPDWLLKIWIEDYDLRPAAQITEANMAPPPLDIMIKDEDSRNFWQSTFKATETGLGAMRCPAGKPLNEMQGYNEGMWWAQSAASSMPAGLLSAVAGDLKGRAVLVFSAAPEIVLPLAAKGAAIQVVERSVSALKRLERALKRLRLEDHVEMTAADPAVWRPKEAPRLIALYAPSSRTGEIRRRPDILRLLSPRDLARYTEIQAAMLGNAFKMLAPGGTLVYSAATLQKEEGERQIRRLFEAQDEAYKQPVSVEEMNGWDEAITEEGDLRILPFHRAALGGMDGYFISRITKIL